MGHMKLIFALTLFSCLLPAAVWSCDLSCPTCVCFPSHTHLITLPGNVQSGSLIPTPPAISPSSLTLTYTLSGSSDFAIARGGSGLVVTTPLDVSVVSAYQLVIHVTDGNSTASLGVNITLIDTSVSSSTLVCTTEAIEVEVIENTNLTASLPVCFHGDGSIAPPSDLTYDGNPSHLFRTTTTGGDAAITSLSPLDYETQVAHTIVINITNSAQPPRTAILVATVTIRPVNEYPPVFDSDPIRLSSSEAVNIGTILGTVQAVDRDTGRDGDITYTLLPPSNESGLLFIHPFSGAIILTDNLDFESEQEHNFTVLASDNSPDNPMSASALLTLTVLDSNDNKPSFARPIYSAAVREDAGSGHRVTTLACSDADSGANGEVLYSITRGNNEGHFSIDNSTGAMSLTTTLDYDRPNAILAYTLTVQCREVRWPNTMSETLLLIRLTSLNEFRPDPGNPYTLPISETTPPGTELLRASERARDRDYGPAGTLRYYLDSNTCPDNLFIDEHTGRLYLMSEFDYESGRTSYDCVLQVWDSEQPIRISDQDIYITIVNVNDAKPTCDPSVYTAELAEDMSVGDSVLTLACSDPDSPNLQYSFTHDDIEEFGLSQRGELTLRRPLDFEMQSLYILHVQVSDNEYSSNTTIYVTVTGVNEHAPSFSALPNCSVLENSVQGTPVCVLQAADSDSGSDGDISFDITHSGDIFHIDPDTGLIYVAAGELDRERDSEYTLTIRVSDMGLPPLSSEANLTMYVADVNDNAPIMEAHIHANISEDAQIGSTVVVIACSDADSADSPNSEVSLRIANTTQELSDGTISLAPSPPFTLNSTSGEIQTLVGLDYESVPLYHLSVVCQDHGSPSLTTPSTVDVRVTPVNEFVPTFSQVAYEVTIAENTTLGTSIVDITATDGDSGPQGDITYSISAPISEYFWIDPQQGALHVVRQLQCDLETRHILRVVASDGGEPGMEASVNVTVNIEQCHLGELVPSSSLYVGSVIENTPVGSHVLNVSCTSTRSLPAANPVYMLSQTSVSDVFEVDSTTGNVMVRSPPDYELSTSHFLNVRCADLNHPEIFADVAVYVAILPTNEHPPVFDQQAYSFSISESAIPGTSVGSIRASDLDSGRDGEMMYSIVDASDVVFINQDTGVIYPARYLDREVQESLSFSFLAFDQPSDPALARSSTVEVLITVLDANDNWPICDKSVYHVYADPQATPPSMLLSNMNCTDADVGDNSRLTYHLGNASSKFSVDPLMGELSLIANFDPEDGVTYRVPIVVRDGGTTPLSVTLLVIVDLQAPPPELPSDGVGEEEYESLVDAEGRKNAVNITLQDLSIPIWEESEVAMEKFHTAVARSVTGHCAIFPEACSLIAGCAQFFGSLTFDPTRRRKRSTSSADETNNYAHFVRPHVVILPNQITEQHAATETGSTSLQIQFYVRLPDSVNQSPNRATNFVVPKATLKHIVSQDSEVIGAVVRNSVTPSLTNQLLDGWKVAAGVLILVVVLGVLCAVGAAVVFGLHKYKQRAMNSVVPFKPPKPKKSKHSLSSIVETIPRQPRKSESELTEQTTGRSKPTRADLFIADVQPHPLGNAETASVEGNPRSTRNKTFTLADSDQSTGLHSCNRHIQKAKHSNSSQESKSTGRNPLQTREQQTSLASGHTHRSVHNSQPGPQAQSSNLGHGLNTSQTSSKSQPTYHRSSVDSNSRMLSQHNENLHASIDSNHSSLFTNSDFSGITGLSMENQVSRDGGGSPRRISSGDLDQSQSSGDGLKERGGGEVGREDDPPFPYTRPTNPVRTNGLSLWRVLR